MAIGIEELALLKEVALAPKQPGGWVATDLTRPGVLGYGELVWRGLLEPRGKDVRLTNKGRQRLASMGVTPTD